MVTEVRIEEDINRLIKEVSADLDEILSSKNIVGEKVVIGDTTIIPLMSVGVGFGAGGGGGRGTGRRGDAGEGKGEGAGAGGQMRPLAVIIVNPDGVKVVPVPAPQSALEKVGAAIGAALAARTEGDKKEPGEEHRGNGKRG